MTNYFSRLFKASFSLVVFYLCFILILTPRIYGEETNPAPVAEDAQPAAMEDVQPQVAESSEPVKVADTNISYTVKKGDSLYVIAKKNDTTVELLKKTNHLTSDLIKPGMELKIPKSKFSIVVDKSDNTLNLFSDGQLYKTYSVATGKDNSTPVGEFKVTTKLENPTWYKAGAVVEPGSPENILGTRWIGYSLKGYGIHGTTQPETIGTQASAGCVRMRNEDVEDLYNLVTSGVVVTVQD